MTDHPSAPLYPNAKNLDQLGGALISILGSAILDSRVIDDHLELRVSPADLLRTLGTLRDNARAACKQLIDICGVDYPSRSERFEVVYHLLSPKLNHRVRVITSLAEGSLLPSATGLFNAANWWEREIWDLFGIGFDGHPDLRRILTDYNFSGHPLRKDFPLTGYVELHYDEASQSVVYAPVKLPQAYRVFDFESPWEGVHRAVRASGPGTTGGKEA